MQDQINIFKSDLIGFHKRKDSDIITIDQENELKEKKRKIDELEKQLKRKKYEQKKQKLFRQKRKETLAKFCAENPDISRKLKIRHNAGRPGIEEDQPLFLKAIIDIALHGCAADDKRRSEIYRSIRTLDELTKQLIEGRFSNW